MNAYVGNIYFEQTIGPHFLGAMSKGILNLNTKAF